MNTKNAGGSAFPQFAKDPWGQTCTRHEGMTLRDYFAAKAVQGLLAQSCGTAMNSDPALGAKYAYQMADAMLAEREKAGN